MFISIDIFIEIMETNIANKIQRALSYEAKISEIIFQILELLDETSKRI